MKIRKYSSPPKLVDNYLPKVNEASMDGTDWGRVRSYWRTDGGWGTAKGRPPSFLYGEVTSTIHLPPRTSSTQNTPLNVTFYTWLEIPTLNYWISFWPCRCMAIFLGPGQYLLVRHRIIECISINATKRTSANFEADSIAWLSAFINSQKLFFHRQRQAKALCRLAGDVMKDWRGAFTGWSIGATHFFAEKAKLIFFLRK